MGGGGGGESVTTSTPGPVNVNYVQSPEQKDLWNLAFPLLQNYVFPGGAPAQTLYDVPGLPTALAQLSPNAPNIGDYIVGSNLYNQVYGTVAPSLWDTYQESVENPLINRFAGSGTLGSNLAGLSGSAADVLLDKRGDAEKNISSQVFQYAQQPLSEGFQGALTEFAAENAMNIANAQALNQAIGQPWEAGIQAAQYPYQILTGILSGSMPTPFVSQSGGTSTTTSSGGGK